MFNTLKGKYFIFSGQNEITGKPNPITGHYSYHGNYYSCGSKKEVKALAEALELAHPNLIVKVGTARKLRKYSLGWSVAEYCEHLHSI